MSLIFDRSIQGLGISKTAYRVALEEGLRQGAVSFRGGTSQIPVMKLGLSMGRVKVSYLLEQREAHFPAEHFKYSST